MSSKRLENEKILITGAAGQVAFPIARHLAAHNEVYGLGRFSKPGDRERLERAGVTCVSADLAWDSFTSVPDDFTYVLNFASTRTGDFDIDLQANAEGTGRLLYHCRGARAWLHCSSSAVYAAAGNRALKETDPLGDSRRNFLPTYSLGKIAAEVMVRFAVRQWGVPATIARLNVAYGNNGGLPAHHLEAILAGTPIRLLPEKPNLRSLLHEDDYIAQIPKLLAAASVPATIVNWGGSDPVSIEDWCGWLGELTGKTPSLVYTDDAFGGAVLDPTRMHALAGRTTVDWRDGMRRMVKALHPELTLRV
ncbi:MAG: NAD(P)-dependent oxidoreductase [Gammaproteobacteria bacterium]|nr:NAD(P)-dependent oxidoreductase [Gammaproteobacteria bacterium]